MISDFYLFWDIFIGGFFFPFFFFFFFFFPETEKGGPLDGVGSGSYDFLKGSANGFRETTARSVIKGDVHPIHDSEA